MKTKTKALVGVILLGLVDMVIPIPILGIILIYVMFWKPSWFLDTVRDIYEER